MEQVPDIFHRFGNYVRSLRCDRGMSQEELAYKCGLDRTYMSDIERGKRNISLKNIEVIANAFDMSVAEFFKRLP